LSPSLPEREDELSTPLPPALGLFGTGLSQNARLITLATAQGSGLPESLMAEQFSGREAVNELFCFEVDALSVSTDLELDLFGGEEISVKLLLADGSRRAWHGICTGAGWRGADGGVARYRLRLEPALALLRERQDNYIFQDKNAREIVTELLADYPQLRFEFDLVQPLAPRAICTQHRESDFAFFRRLLASEGLSWRFEHDQAGEGDDAQARHRLIIFDSKAKIPAMPGQAELRFHGVRATDTQDAIDRFSATRQAQANAATTSSWDPAQLVAPAAGQSSSLDCGELPVLEVHDGSGERRHADGAQAELHSELMLQAFELDNKVFTGAGAVRQLAAGHAFRLTRHARYGDGDDRFTVLWVEHAARNNFESALARTGNGASLDNGTYRNQFGCVREEVAIVPRAVAQRRDSSARGSQTALVVGLPDAVATSMRDHQVKVQFPWQRGTSPNPGGVGHNTDQGGNAPGNDSSGAWVRVAEALAGPNWGTQFTPRIGAEVLVDFAEGDMDRPLIVSQLYTGSDAPPYPAGVDAGVNHAGVLSGIHSHNFDGGGFNQWQLDDTPGQLRTRLASSTAATQLNLGYLVQQAPESAQRGGYRGSGFELRTDAWAVLRAGEGLLLSSTARTRQGSGVASTQLDAAEAVACLKGARELGKVMTDAAMQQNGLVSKEAGQAQADFIAQIDAHEKGKYAGAVGGQAALKAKDGAKEHDAEQPVEKFGAPLILMDSPSTINWATAASTVVHAGQQLHWTTQADVHLAAGHTVAAVAAGAAGFFCHAGGVQAIAANGAVSLQAHTDQLEIVADKGITVTAVNDAIEIKAKQKITLQAGQSAITLDGGDITFACPGNFTVKGGQHTFDGGGKKSAELPSLPGSLSKLKNFIALNYRGLDGKPMDGVGYKIKFADGQVVNGKLDQAGTARHENVPEKPTSVEYEMRKPLPEQPWEPLAKMLEKANAKFSN
jgi:type VI secretion system secreted protein VgrG